MATMAQIACLLRPNAAIQRGGWCFSVLTSGGGGIAAGRPGSNGSVDRVRPTVRLLGHRPSFARTSLSASRSCAPVWPGDFRTASTRRHRAVYARPPNVLGAEVKNLATLAIEMSRARRQDSRGSEQVPRCVSVRAVKALSAGLTVKH